MRPRIIGAIGLKNKYVEDKLNVLYLVDRLELLPFGARHKLHPEISGLRRQEDIYGYVYLTITWFIDKRVMTMT